MFIRVRPKKLLSGVYSYGGSGHKKNQAGMIMCRARLLCKSCYWVLCALLCLYGEDLALLPQVKQWFEWGEYTRIIQAVNPVLADTTCALSLDTAAYLHLYLGVACFAEGDVWKARKEFIEAIGSMPTIALDMRYVNGEIFALFTATRDEVTQQQNTKTKESLKEVQNVRIQEKNIAVIDSLDRTVHAVKKRGLIISAISLTGLSLGLAGVAVYEYNNAEEEYDKFLLVSAQGDYPEYNRLKALVDVHDKRTILAGSASVVIAVAGGIMYIAAHKYNRHPVNPPGRAGKISLFTTHNMVQVTVNF